MEEREKDVCNVPLIFAEMLKDEINANDERKMYNGIKKIVKKHSDDKNAISVINEYTKAITGGASLNEILQIANDEIINPTLSSELTVDKTCETD